MKKLFLVFSLINLSFWGLNAQDAVVSSERMNLFYMGLDNPIAIAVPNVSSDKINVTIDNQATIQKVSTGNYMVKVINVGQVTITVEANGQITKKRFRVKQFPDPTPTAGGLKDGLVELGRFKNVNGVTATLLNMDIDARCSVQSYTIVIKPRRGDIFQVNITGYMFSQEIEKRIQMLGIGDTVSFLDIKARCPGDEIARNLGSLNYIMR